MAASLLDLALAVDDGDQSQGYEPTYDDTSCGQGVPAYAEHQDTVNRISDKIPEANQDVSQQKEGGIGYEPTKKKRHWRLSHRQRRDRSYWRTTMKL